MGSNRRRDRRRAGTFHVPGHIYGKMLRFLKERDQDVCRNSFEEGPSRKLRLIDKAFDILGLAFSYRETTRYLELNLSIHN